MQTFGFDFSDTIPGIVEDIMSHWSLVKNFQNRLKDTVRAYKTVPGCLVCGATTVPLLDLHQQPLANKYHTELSIPESYPLRLDYCPECFHSQLSVAVNPDKFFKNYLYVSGTSKTLRDYFRKFARFSLERLQMLKETVGKQKSIRVLEIACNDGSLLDEYEALERKTGMGILRVGVDPAENIYQNITRKKNHHIYCEYFTQTTVDKLLSDFGSFDLIVAQNVIAHIDYPGLFLDLCKQLISPSHGVLFLQTSQKNMIRNGEFDTVYHEHLSFFSANSMEKLCSKKGMILNNITEDEIHGTSYVFEVLPAPLPAPSNTKAVIEEERKAGLYDPTTFTKYKHDALYYKNTFHNRLLDYRLRFRIIGYGSTAKSNTLLNFCGIGSDLIDWIVDDNLLKQGLYTPGSDIPICSTDSLRTIDTERTVLVVFAWNFFQEIKEKIIRIFRDEYGKSGTLRILNIHPLEEHAVSL